MEFAVVAPIFFLLILGMVEFGRMMMVQQVLTNASREGARIAVLDNTTTADVTTQLTSALSAEDIIELSRIVRRVPVADHLARYAIQFARRTRVGYGEVPDMVRANVSWGAGPRASQYLVLAAKARAVLHGRYYVSGDDIRAVAPPVLRHRIVTNFNAEAEGIKPDDIVHLLLEHIPSTADETDRGNEPQVFRSADAG